EIVHAHVLDLEQYLATVGEAAGNEILHDFLLAINGYTLADQLAKIDVMQRAAEAEADAVMRQPFPLHALANADLDQKIARPLLDQAGADAALDVIATAVLQDDRVDACKVQKMREHQPCRSRADDSNLCAHV